MAIMIKEIVLLVPFVFIGCLHVASARVLRAASAEPGRVQIGSGIRLLAPIDQYYTLCDSMLGAAKNLSLSYTVNFYPTQNYVDDNIDGNPESYCYVTGGGSCEPITAESTKRFQAAMNYCVKLAYDIGFRTIELTPRLDELWNRKWRNEMSIDPHLQLNGVSYKIGVIDVMVNAANVLADKDDVTIFFNLQGEMNFPLIAFPKSWKLLAEEVAKTLKVNSKIGINMNFNKVCYYCTGGNYKPNGYNENFDNAAIQGLFNHVDFVGMSAYAPLLDGSEAFPYVSPEKIQLSIWTLATELGHFGVDLKSMNRKGFPIHFSEFGLGGGTCGDGKCPAANAWDVARYPYFGVAPPQYDWYLDPWKNTDSRNFRVQFYKSAIQFVAGKYDFSVSNIFLWNHMSYDVQGIFPGSSTAYGSYADKEITEFIAKWNSAGVVPV